MKGFYNYLGSIATAVIAATSIVGLWVVTEQLHEIRDQTQNTQLALRQSFRPLGVVKYTHDGYNVRALTVGIEERTDRFYMDYDLNIMNRGTGVMLYIGSFTFIYHSETAFRDSLLGGAIDSLIFDHRYAYLRFEPFLVGEQTNRPVMLQHLVFAEEIYVYTLFLYTDQLGNLYDTEHLDVFRFKIPSPGDTMLVPDRKAEGSLGTDRYHAYTSKEVELLLRALNNLDHPMIEAIHKALSK
ncbi:MAG TPA: hypothetical protein VN285_13520 [Candidatus Deferrimicrobium sp.]|nr:hypothetical protein [Candidatus Deferrimicrobium sp.]